MYIYKTMLFNKYIDSLLFTRTINIIIGVDMAVFATS